MRYNKKNVQVILFYISLRNNKNTKVFDNNDNNEKYFTIKKIISHFYLRLYIIAFLRLFFFTFSFDFIAYQLLLVIQC